MKKNFWNNWDFKTIVTIAIIIGQFIWLTATNNNKISAIEKQRDKDIETVKLIRDNDIKGLSDDIKEIRDMVKEIRQDIKEKKDK